MSFLRTIIPYLLVVCLCILLYVCTLPKVLETVSLQEEVTVPIRTIPTSILKENKPEAVDTALSYNAIQFVGDVMMARSVENVMKGYGAKYPFSYLPKVATSTYLVGNFEGSIPKVHIPTQSMQFSFSVEEKFIQQLSEYGFTHMGLANNHSYDFGSDDFLHTIEVLKENNLNPFGDQRNQASSTVVYLQIDAITVAIIGVYAVDVAPDEATLKRLVAIASKNSDMQVAYVHFGTEYASTHSPFQASLAHKLVDSGIDLVVGHHPHVVQDIEEYKGTLIFYSLGNFLFDQYFSQEVQEGLQLVLTASQSEMKITLLPVSSIGSRSAPRIMGGVERKVFLETLAKKSSTTLKNMIEQGNVVITR